MSYDTGWARGGEKDRREVKASFESWDLRGKRGRLCHTMDWSRVSAFQLFHRFYLHDLLHATPHTNVLHTNSKGREFAE